MTTFPARIHGLLAQDAPYGVIIRRGPSKQVCFIGWDRDTDTFTLGQWLKGHIYERRSDLSPDGKHLIYFAMNGHESWTTLSRAPYLKAIGLWFKGDCWHGGGLFIDKGKYWLNEGLYHTPSFVPLKLQRVADYPDTTYYGDECLGVYYLRLLRDGWELKDRWVLNAEAGQFKRDGVTVFEKRINDTWILRKLAHATVNHPAGKGCYYDEHELVNIKTGDKVDGAAWEWAEVDRHRLVWAQDGKLLAGRVTKQGLQYRTELYDFNAMTFEPLAAPY